MVTRLPLQVALLQLYLGICYHGYKVTAPGCFVTVLPWDMLPWLQGYCSRLLCNSFTLGYVTMVTRLPLQVALLQFYPGICYYGYARLPLQVAL